MCKMRQQKNLYQGMDFFLRIEHIKVTKLHESFVHLRNSFNHLVLKYTILYQKIHTLFKY